MSSDMLKKIYDELTSSGYPCELEVTSILEKNRFIVRSQEPYLDVTDNKIKTIDILSYIEKGNIKNGVIEIFLAIECKKSVKPWVIFVKDIKEYEDLWEFTMHQKYYIDKKIGLKDGVHAEHQDGVKKRGYIAVQAFTRGDNKEIFEALNQVTKFLNYYNEKYKEHLKQTSVKRIVYFYPVIVFDGDLYSVEKLDSEKDIVKTDYIVYSFPLTLIDTNIKDKILVDIVQKKAFLKYLDHIKWDLEHVVIL